MRLLDLQLTRASRRKYDWTVEIIINYRLSCWLHYCDVLFVWRI